ncbi:fimbrillin family protein [Bacteroides gallinaceum]|uniref:fimbrillin family protein n=1 Tax=Bacteroides gallinaceum TaxID=1462571 RepID=UPI00195C601F|nr:fimbrillin family protein [Bacteroides gallinaceum]MBM6718310.1 fimbrillin family protein [Bacteroides gallinaceum]
MILKQLKYGAGILALLGITACTHEDAISVTPSEEQETILSARKSHIITRAGDEVKQFEEGTKYLLYANRGNEWPLYNREGIEQANNTIGYGSPLVYDDTPISIYGVTYGTAASSPSQAPENTPLDNPMIEEEVTDNSLPDLMYSNNLTNQTLASNGYRLEMDFKHAMSKVKFMIVKQDELEDTDKKLEGVTLKDITVKRTHRSGTFDIVKGTWHYDNSDGFGERNYFSGKQDITTTSTKVSGELLLFPNADNEEVSISVTLGNLEGGDKKVEYKLRKVDEEGNDVGVFQFEVNHQYTLLITVLKDEVRTIAIAPQVYDWIDEDRKDNYLGQPVTFANLMWMDRNLGAKSADCENEWENCRGYYYQYARNIPYILDKEKYDAAPNKIPVYPFLYTYNQYGQKVYGGVQAGTVLDGVSVRYPNIAVNPGDEGIYEFVWDSGGENGCWMLDETENREDEFVNTYWTQSSENHPCPKGWRLPTQEDFASFLPEIALSSWGNWYDGYRYNLNYTGHTLSLPEAVVHGTIDGERAIYLIKRKGRSDCYRIRILLKESKSDRNKSYYEFAYFSGDANMTFNGLTSEELFLASGLDWSTPTAIMQVPACGFIHTTGMQGLNSDGISTILRSSDYNLTFGVDNFSYNWVCYLRRDYNFGLFGRSRKCLGDQIRCVRDVTAEK